ncbi:MAG: ABC transporter permease [Patescibacteria group bacterium]|jgi:hypothetical protein|nr:ABC transporter permease [Patescibacteria group bacterium]
MILFRDTTKLALTKLKIRIPRLIITVIVASLLFSLCIFVLVIVKGAVNSLESFNSEGLSNRYLVIGNTAVNLNIYNNPELIKMVEDAQKEQIKQKTAEAKRLGIEYDPKSEQPWVETAPDKSKYLMGNSLTVNNIIENYIRKDQNLTYEYFKKTALSNGAIDTFRVTNEFGGAFGPGVGQGGQIKVLKDGKENYKLNQGMGFDPFGVKGFASIETTNLRAVDESLLRPFTLPDQTLKYSDNEIPALVPYSVAEEALGIAPLKGDVKPDQKLARIQEVRQFIAGKKILICYRNDTSKQDIEKVLLQKQEIEQNKGKKDYIMPLVIYDLPNQPCGPIVITSDKRTSEQKKLEAKQEEFELKFGKELPKSKTQIIRIVGLVPDRADIFSGSISSILSGVVSTSVGSGWITTLEVAQKPELAGIVTDINSLSSQNVQFVAELPDAETQKKFIKEQSCDVGDGNYFQSPMGFGGYASDPTQKCKDEGKYYFYTVYGNNASAIDDFEKGFYKFFKVALITIAILSSIILMGIMARIIADGRRETAVFRAIGATKLDISLIYTLYALIISSFVAISAVLIGYLSAYIFSNHFSPQVTPNALLVFNSTDINKQFTFVGLDGEKLLLVIAVVFASGLVGLALPLLSNLRRSPLKDMRDEN